MDYPNKVQKYKVLITKYKKFEKNIKDKKKLKQGRLLFRFAN